MEQPGDRQTTEQETNTSISLKEYLLQAMKDPKLAIQSLPKAIDLGEFGREVERLVQLSQQDPEHPEYGSIGYFDNKGLLVILRQPIRGSSHTVRLPDPPPHKRRAIVLHTHPEDTPFSFTDLSTLLYPPSDSNANAAELLATPSVKMLLVRTQLTPVLRNRMEAIARTAFADEELAYANNPSDTKVPFASRNMFEITRAVQEYKLAMYSCSLKSNPALLLN